MTAPAYPGNPDTVLDTVYGMLAMYEWDPTITPKESRNLLVEARDVLRDYTNARAEWEEYQARQENPTRIPPHDEPPHCAHPRWGGPYDNWWHCCHGGSNCGACYARPEVCLPNDGYLPDEYYNTQANEDA